MAIGRKCRLTDKSRKKINEIVDAEFDKMFNESETAKPEGAPWFSRMFSVIPCISRCPR